MKLPDGWEGFYQDVCNRTKTLASCNIWSMQATTALAWLGNFEIDEHRYIAAHILDRATYRTEKMTEGGYRSFISSIFREYATSRISIQHNSISEWLDILKSRPEGEHKNIKICSVSKKGDNGDSGSHMIRLLTGGLFHQNRSISPDSTPLHSLKGNLILIVDDFVGSGEQFASFAKETGLIEAARNNHIVYAPAIGYHQGISAIINCKLGISLYPLEVIKESERFFTHIPDSMFCGDNINREADVIACYKSMRHIDPSFSKNSWLGRDKASLSVIFQWGCPNQSLGIMWYEGSENWNRLARRRGEQ